MSNECKELSIGFNDKMFYAKVCGKRAVRLLYEIDNDVFHIISTYTLRAFRGKGLASKVVKKALEYALERKFRKLKVSCSFVKKWLEKHPEFKDKFEEIIFLA